MRTTEWALKFLCNFPVATHLAVANERARAETRLLETYRATTASSPGLRFRYASWADKYHTRRTVSYIFGFMRFPTYQYCLVCAITIAFCTADI